MSPEKRSLDWEYLTDFTHHKLLLVDGKFAQMGGRNLEDSYHMQPNALSSKYTFMDTDIYFSLKREDAKLVTSFEKLWNFRPLVIGRDEIQKTMPYDFVANMNYAGLFCQSEVVNPDLPAEENKKLVMECVQAKLGSGNPVVSLDRRLEDQKKNMLEKVKVYETYAQKFISRKYEESFSLSASDAQVVSLAYLESLTFSKDSDVGKANRIYGSKNNEPAKHGRYIHATWVSGMEEVCAETAKSGQVEDIIMHNAYFAPPSVLLDAFGKMVDGSWNCGNVRVSILANSVDTTDLRSVNSFGLYGMKGFYDYYRRQIRGNSSCKLQIQSDGQVVSQGKSNRCAQFRYMEYAAMDDNESQKSLHSKVTVLGSSNMIVGSANADYRSYMHDTNNALYIRNAKDIVGSYTSWLFKEIVDAGKVLDLNAFMFNSSLQAINAENIRRLEKDFEKYGIEKRLNPNQIETAKKYIMGILEEVYKLSGSAVDSLVHLKSNPIGEPSEAENKRKEKNKDMNSLDRLFKFI